MINFRLKQASNWQREDRIVINTIEELMAFVEENGKIIISIEKE